VTSIRLLSLLRWVGAKVRALQAAGLNHVDDNSAKVPASFLDQDEICGLSAELEDFHPQFLKIPLKLPVREFAVDRHIAK